MDGNRPVSRRISRSSSEGLLGPTPQSTLVELAILRVLGRARLMRQVGIHEERSVINAFR